MTSGIEERFEVIPAQFEMRWCCETIAKEKIPFLEMKWNGRTPLVYKTFLKVLTSIVFFAHLMSFTTKC